MANPCMFYGIPCEAGPNSCGYPGCTIGGGHSHPNWDGHGGAGVLGVARGLAGEGGIIP